MTTLSKHNRLMKYKAYNIIFLTPVIALVIVLSACSDLSKITEYHEDGSVYSIYRIDKDSLQQGYYVAYYPGNKDQILEEANYVDGLLQGERKIYYEDGTVEIQERYDQDVLVDTLRVYYQSGQLERKASYQDGVLSGMIISYYPSGVIKEEVTVANNMENGPFVEYHDNGQPKWKGTFLNGDQEFGELSEYNEEGILIKKMMCDSHAVCSTVWKIEKGDL